MEIMNCLTKGDRKVQNYPNVPFQEDQQNWKTSGMYEDQHTTASHCESLLPLFPVIILSLLSHLLQTLFNTAMTYKFLHTKDLQNKEFYSATKRNILILSAVATFLPAPLIAHHHKHHPFSATLQPK